MEIDKYFPLKKGSVGPPSNYLGGKVSKVQLPNGVEAYAWSMSQYVQTAVESLEKKIDKMGLKLSKRCTLPMANNYHPELDTSEELSVESSNYYQSLIGILR